MKALKYIICSLLIISSSADLLSQSEKTKDILQLLLISGRYQANEEMLKVRKEYIRSYPPEDVYFDPYDIYDNFLQGLDYQMIQDTMVSCYDKTYTHEEIKDLINFYNTPVGKKLVEEGDRINESFFELSSEYGEEVLYNIMNEKQIQAAKYTRDLYTYIQDLDPRGALMAVDSAIAIYPFSPDNYETRFFIHLLLRNYKEIVKDITTMIGFDYEADKPYFYLLRAYASYELGKHTDMVNDLYKILKLDYLMSNLDHLAESEEGGDPEILLNSVDAKLDRIIESDPHYGLTYYVRAAYKIIKQYAISPDKQLDVNKLIAIKADLDRAIDLNPDLIDAYALRLQCNNQLRDYHEMISDCNRLIEVNPNITEVYIYRARANLGLGRYKEAIVDCGKLSDAGNDFEDFFIPAYMDYPEAYNGETHFIQGISLLKAGDSETPARIFESIVPYGEYILHINLLGGEVSRLAGSDAEAINRFYNAMIFEEFYRADFNYAFQFYDEKSRILEQVFTREFLFFLDQAQNNAEISTRTHFLRSHVKYFLHDFTGALSDLNNLITENPDFTEALYLRAWIHIKQEEFSSALDDLLHLLEIEQDFKQSGLYYSIAQLKAKLDDHEGVVEYIEKALDTGSLYDLTPDRLNLYIASAEKLGEVTKAIEVLNEITDYYSNLTYDHQKGKLKLAAGDYQGAWAALSETWQPEILMFRQQPGLADIYSNLSFDPRSEFEEIARAFPDSAGPQFVKGLLSYKLNDLEAAEKEFTSIIKAFPDSPEGYAGNGIVLSEQGNYKKALKAFDEALSLDPEYTMGYYCRGETRSKMGDHKGACEDWEEFRLRYTLREEHLYLLNYYCRPAD